MWLRSQAYIYYIDPKIINIHSFVGEYKDMRTLLVQSQLWTHVAKRQIEKMRISTVVT